MRLRRACLGCGQLGRWRSRCPRCQAQLDKRKASARPALRTYAQTKRRREAVAAHRAEVGDWCPGVSELGRPGHPSARLQADHVVEVAAGGSESGPLVVRCGPCNSARSANVRRFPQGTAAATPRPSKFATHTGGDGPAVA